MYWISSIPSRMHKHESNYFAHSSEMAEPLRIEYTSIVYMNLRKKNDKQNLLA